MVITQAFRPIVLMFVRTLSAGMELTGAAERVWKWFLPAISLSICVGLFGSRPASRGRIWSLTTVSLSPCWYSLLCISFWALAAESRNRPRGRRSGGEEVSHAFLHALESPGSSDSDRRPCSGSAPRVHRGRTAFREGGSRFGGEHPAVRLADPVRMGIR